MTRDAIRTDGRVDGVSRQGVHGVDPDAVLAAIQARHAAVTSGGVVSDGRKLGLVVEGGAMRGVLSAGGAVALAQMGLSDVFDEVYATSAAVMNASYFITNQPLRGISVYFDHCTTRHFINPWRIWKVVDVDYVFDHVAVHEKVLDTARLLSARSRLFVAVIDKNTGEAFMVDVQAARDPALQVLKASAAIPVLYNRTVDVGGRACMDGGLAIPVGVVQAVDRGCTDVLVLSTRAAGYVSSEPTWLSRTMFNLICARGRRGLNEVFAHRHLRSREARDLSMGRTPPPAGVHIATICADDDEPVERLTMDRSILHAGAVRYGRKVLRAFGHPKADGWTLPFDCAAAGRQSPEPLLSKS